MEQFSFLGNSEIQTIEQLYNDYLKDSQLVDESWKQFFKGFEFARKNYSTNGEYSAVFEKEFKVLNLIDAYRRRGHLFTKTNPVRDRRKYTPTLDLENFDLSTNDLEKVFHAGKEIGIGSASLNDIISHLQQTYCQSIGVEFQYIRDPKIIAWLLTKMEVSRNTPNYSSDEKKQIYQHLKLAVGFEQFIHKRFVGQKRFSLEGAESLIPALDAVIEKGAEIGIEEFIIGMSHRGRLNVFANILQKPYEDIFREFLGKPNNDEETVQGDVKYHLGYENEIVTENGNKVSLKAAPNPSHLEAVDPVVEGLAHARVRDHYKKDYNKLAPILIHGDAAIAAQGVVYETIQMSQLKGFKNGGTIHLVVNNQIGFTTNYLDARSSTYCTDIAKVVLAPVFHVNGDDVEALVYTIQLALEYRQEFHADVFIDILCYRKYGHNEGDEPRFTQPVLYDIISKHPNPRDIYSKILIEQNILTEDDVHKAEKDFDDLLDEKLNLAKNDPQIRISGFFKNEWQHYRHACFEDFEKSPETGVEKEKLLSIADKINTLPDDKKFFQKIAKIVEDRKKMIEINHLDWGMCELLAYGSLVSEGHQVRVSGQDSERGTFSHRHAAFVIEDSTKKFFPLKHISEGQSPFHIFNSPLSEYAVLGFEYGYSLALPNGLTIWEAQYGDFHNGGQIIVDQFISSAEEKWGVSNGLVVFLPHGYEGQGPEHSSARIERFLILSANCNMYIVNCTTPANIFHVLRRQVNQNFRLPLVIFTPKSLLRHPRCISTLEDLSAGSFREVIDDEFVQADTVGQVVFTSGKLYYEILEKREELDVKDTAIVRIEQLYPFPEKQINSILKKYIKAERLLWAQEEPANMGAWSFINRNFKDNKLLLISRPASGSPAAGYSEVHKRQSQKILDKIFKKCDCESALNYCEMKCESNKNTTEVSV